MRSLTGSLMGHSWVTHGSLMGSGCSGLRCSIRRRAFGVILDFPGSLAASKDCIVESPVIFALRVYRFGGCDPAVDAIVYF